MKYAIKNILLIVLLIILSNQVRSQDRFVILENKLSELAKENSGLNEEIEISVNGASVQEFIRGVANSANINIDVDPSLDISIVNNFVGVKVSDILVFLARQYNLDISNIGSIITVEAFKEPKVPVLKKIDKINVTYNARNDLLSYDLANDTLWKVLKEITHVSGKNVVVPSSMKNKIVDGYIQNMPFDNVIEKFAATNDLTYEKTDDNFYLLSERGIEIVKSNNTSKGSSTDLNNSSSNESAGDAIIKVYSFYNINVYSQEVSLDWLIRQVSDSLGINYVVISEIEGVKGMKLTNTNYDDFLLHSLEGTKYTFNKVNNVYIVGDRHDLALLNTRVVQMQYRSVDQIIDYVPDDLKKGISLKEFTELNSVVVTGPSSRIDVIESFLRDVDKVVPVILIEVMIVDYNKNHTITTGITAGLGENPNPSAQTFLPGIDYSISTKSLNNLIGKFEGYGWFNLGKVSPDFYLTVKALESNGIIKIRSTPKLSTLNGHEANMSSGETKYYKEEKSNYYGTQNPSMANSYTWNPITADLALTIKPFVSGDEQITLEVEVTQSEFTPREFEDSPPGSVTRKFKSLVRMKDGEMILLGGLEKERSQNIGTGVPLLSRIPIIKWLFSSKTKTQEESRLNIFIQPTIIF